MKKKEVAILYVEFQSTNSAFERVNPPSCGFENSEIKAFCHTPKVRSVSERFKFDADRKFIAPHGKRKKLPQVQRRRAGMERYEGKCITATGLVTFLERELKCSK